MKNTMGFKIGDLCHIKENTGNNIRLKLDNYKPYTIVGFVFYDLKLYVLLYGTNMGGFTGKYVPHDIVDENCQAINISEDIIHEAKFTFININEIESSIKLSNTKLKNIYNNVKS